MSRLCAYCHQSREDDRNGWHTCSQANTAKCRLEATVNGIHALMERPGSKELTSNGMRLRADRLRTTVNIIRALGGEVNEEYL